MLHNLVDNEGTTSPALMCFYDERFTTKLHQTTLGRHYGAGKYLVCAAC